MTKLLVSVRDPIEAREAQLGGADLIDLKEPLKGSLGFLEPDEWPVIRAAVPQAPLSVALGELASDPVERHAAQTAGFRFAKIGLAGCAGLPDWPERWQAAWQWLPRGVAPVAVAYADFQQAQSPHPEQVLQTGRSLGCRAFLVDTFEKSNGSLLDHLPLAELRQLIEAAQRAEIPIVLAGSLDLEKIATLVELSPDYIGVRGAVCSGSRTGQLQRERVAHVAALMRADRSLDTGS